MDRARAIYELAVNQSRLDMPEILWKAYIDFEIGLGEPQNARQLYERLLERTHHVKVEKHFFSFFATIIKILFAEIKNINANFVNYQLAYSPLSNILNEQRENYISFEILYGLQSSILSGLT